MDKEIIFEKVSSKTHKFLLKWNSRYTSCIMGLFTQVKYSQDYICLKPECIFKVNVNVKYKVNDTFLMT